MEESRATWTSGRRMTRQGQGGSSCAERWLDVVCTDVRTHALPATSVTSASSLRSLQRRTTERQGWRPREEHTALRGRPRADCRESLTLTFRTAGSQWSSEPPCRRVHDSGDQMQVAGSSSSPHPAFPHTVTLFAPRSRKLRLTSGAGPARTSPLSNPWLPSLSTGSTRALLPRSARPAWTAWRPGHPVTS